MSKKKTQKIQVKKWKCNKWDLWLLFVFVFCFVFGILDVVFIIENLTWRFIYAGLTGALLVVIINYIMEMEKKPYWKEVEIRK